MRGIEALAAVVMNRAALPPGGSVEDACWSFACWSDDNPSRSRMLGLKSGGGSAARAAVHHLHADRPPRGGWLAERPDGRRYDVP